MNNNKRITWISGKASGLYIDLNNQTVGFSGNEKSLNRLQTRLISFMASESDGFVTANDTSRDPELFSIDYLKYISSIKSVIRGVIRASDKTCDPEEIVDQVFEKRKEYGNTGYRIRLEQTDYKAEVISEDISDDTESCDIAAAEPAITVEEPEDTPAKKSFSSTMRTYFENNWFPLFIYSFLILGLILLLDGLKTAPSSLILKLTKIPFGITFAGLTVISVLPVLGGLLIDVPLALRKYAKTKGVSVKDLDPDLIHEIAMYTVPRFDNSKEHILFFLLCNLTGTFTVASVLLYAKSIPGITEYLMRADHNYAYLIITIAGCFVALINNFMLQTGKSSSRSPKTYILSRVHAFFNLIHLSITLPLISALLYTFLSYRFNSTGNTAVITPAYIVMTVSACCYLWFSSDSPAARKIDSVSKHNFIAGLPVTVAFSTIYTIMCFVPGPVCIISLIVNLLFLLPWTVTLIKQKKAHALKLNYFVLSFFSVMAISVIVMLAMGFMK